MTDRRKECFAPDLKDVNESKRQITHLISTAKLDRAGDIVDVEGWDLRSYRRNPVVVADHSYSIGALIGTGKPFKGEDGLYSTTTFADTELGEQAWELARQRIARGWSVGFQVIKGGSHRMSESAEDCETCAKVKNPGWGVHFTKQELLEYSLVAVPMNPDTVTHAMDTCGVTQKTLNVFFRPEGEDVSRRGSQRPADRRARFLNQVAGRILRHATASALARGARRHTDA